MKVRESYQNKKNFLIVLCTLVTVMIPVYIVWDTGKSMAGCIVGAACLFLNGILVASYGQIIHYGSCAGTVRFAGYIDGAHGERGVSGDGGYHAFQAAGECGQADPENASSK